MTTFHERTEEMIRAREQQLGRPLTLDEQDEIKELAFQEMWMQASREAAAKTRPEEGQRS